MSTPGGFFLRKDTSSKEEETALRKKSDRRKSECNLQLNMDSRRPHSAHNFLLHPRAHKTFDCGICSEELSGILKLRRHLKTVHQKRLYRCKDCDQIMATKKLQKDHNLEFHPDKIGRPKIPKAKKTFDCDICSEEFKSTLRLKRHLKKLHQKKLYRCKDCNLNMINVAVIRAHNLEFHPEKPPITPRTKRSRRATIPTKGCEICPEKFCTVTELGRHLNVVHRNKFYRCEDCDLTLASWHLFNNHNKKFHPESSERSGSDQIKSVRSHQQAF